MKYVNITHMLKTVFSSDFGLSDEVAVSIYTKSLIDSNKLEDMKIELTEAFQDNTISWINILSNDEYEVLECETEIEAKSYIERVLWEPIKEL